MRKTKISSYRIECVNDDNRENRKNPRSKAKKTTMIIAKKKFLVRKQKSYEDNCKNEENPRSNSNNSNITSRKAKKILVISKFTRNFQKKLQFF